MTEEEVARELEFWAKLCMADLARRLRVAKSNDARKRIRWIIMDAYLRRDPDSLASFPDKLIHKIGFRVSRNEQDALILDLASKIGSSDIKTIIPTEKTIERY